MKPIFKQAVWLLLTSLPFLLSTAWGANPHERDTRPHVEHPARQTHEGTRPTQPRREPEPRVEAEHGTKPRPWHGEGKFGFRRFDSLRQLQRIHQDNLDYLEELLENVPLPDGEKIELIYFFQALFRSDISFRRPEFVDLIDGFFRIASDPRLTQDQRKSFLRHLVLEDYYGGELYLQTELDREWDGWKHDHGFSISVNLGHHRKH